jgi:hypothetical protein
MNVRTEKGHELLFHHLNDSGVTTLLSRIERLDKESTLCVVPRYFDEPTHYQEYWVTFNKGNILYLSQHSAITGEVKRKTVIEGLRPETSK